MGCVGEGGARVASFFFHAKAVQITEKAETSVWLSQISKSHVCYWCKMGTDDHVPFYPALLNSL